MKVIIDTNNLNPINRRMNIKNNYMTTRISRAAMMLLMMLLTATTAWAQNSVDLADFLTAANIHAPQDENGAYLVMPDVSYQFALTFAERYGNDGTLQFPNDDSDMTYTFPEGLNVADGLEGTFTIAVKDGANTYRITDNTYRVDGRVLTVNFNSVHEYFSKLTAITNAQFTLSFEGTISQDADKLVFAVGIEKAIVIDDSNSVTVLKSSKVDFNAKEITYTVTVQSYGKSENVCVKDIMTSTIDGLITALSDFSIKFSVSDHQVSTITPAMGDGYFTYNIPQMSHGEVITISYKAAFDPTKLSSDGNGHSIGVVNNTAEVWIGDATEHESASLETTIDSTVGDAEVLKKELLTSDADLIKINEDIWAEFRITLNSGEQQLNGGQPLTMTDTATNLNVDVTSIKAEPSEGVTWEMTDNTVTYTIPDATSVVITYKARVTMTTVPEVGTSQRTTFSNRAEMKDYSDEVVKTAVLWNGGQGSASIASINLIVHVAGNINKRLSGAKFQLQDKDKNPVLDKDDKPVEFVSDDDGMITIKGDLGSLGWAIKEGEKYYLEELEAPTGYKPAESLYQFTVSADGTTDYSNYIYYSGDTMMVENYPDPTHFSDDGNDTYTIHTAVGWNVFCDALDDNTTWNGFSGKTVKLDANIEVSRMAGSSGHDFCGTFDGGEYTLTFNYGTSGTPASVENVAPFSYVSNTKANPSDATDSPAAIKNLHVAGHIYTSAKYAAGIIGQHCGTLNIENCRSSIVIHSSTNGDGIHGGFEAASNGTLNITGCVFDGKLLTKNTGNDATTNCGGFVGYGTCTISNSLYAPAGLADGETEITSGSATFVRNGSVGTNCYYTRTLGTAQGKEAHSITAGENVTVALSGTATEYNVSGITAYSLTPSPSPNGEGSFSPGLLYNGTLYAGNEDEVSLTLSYSGTVPTGYQYSGYTASNGGTVSGNATDGWTLTMPDEDVTISPDFEIIQFEQNGLRYKWNVAVPNSVMVIDCELGDEGIAIPNTVEHNGVTYDVTAIGDDAFGDKTTLASISFPAKLVSIGSRAFKGCMNLSVTIPVGVTLGGEAFNGVYKVTSLLADNADNSALISSYIGAVMNVSDTNITLSGRTLLKDGSWNTLCLPFSLTAGNIAASPLAGATIKELDNSADGTNLTDGTLTLKFKDATSIEAGKPYIVKWTTTGDAITDPTFRDPAFDNSTEAQANMTVTSYDQNVKFVGQWSPFTIGDTSNGTYDGDINEIIYVAAGNKIGYSSKARTLKSCRAHFWVKPNGTQQAASMINVDFGDGTSSITPNSSLTPNPSPKGEGSDYWYDMSGRKLSQQPTQKGLYIHNGRKVVIK